MTTRIQRAQRTASAKVRAAARRKSQRERNGASDGNPPSFPKRVREHECLHWERGHYRQVTGERCCPTCLEYRARNDAEIGRIASGEWDTVAQEHRERGEQPE